ncbi:DUF1800 domain-containing protein [Pedobacter cryophilus]|uniref:DUF1800 domain-containing protein n=1 Tax=Pedobacter cryophilus TaxID=2571271 RepID=A0A4U1C673_9SPHI|nr:DUF1800 domain-containing protein [Pedobacter cryophilus]TKC00815.1 DUF1800 domain-containing protein [Pedobacter cryophilus]
MKTLLKYFYLPFVLLVGVLFFSSFLVDKSDKGQASFPYKKAGLTDRQAALHLLNRFTYGAKTEDIDFVLKTGLEKWFQQQLTGKLADDSLKQMLSVYDVINLSNQEVSNIYPKGAQVLRRAIKDGYIDKDSVNKADQKEYRNKLKAYMDDKGLKPQQELFRQFINQKILRATYTNNQLQEVLTDFWFNHFNVSITKNDCAMFIPAYERDVIRPNVFGKFENLVLATAKSPAMLYYLDNFSSAGTNTNLEVQPKRNPAMLNQTVNDNMKAAALQKLQQNRKNQGLNENYAREVMELHTLGVDGGYTQQDVTQAAKVLTGWTVFPMDEEGAGGAIKKMIEKVGESKLEERGFIHQGDFLFAANRHDTGEKNVLGKRFTANGGYEEGVQLLTMLAKNPSTAKFITKKLAVRFVSDNPPQSLLDKMSKTFLDKGGDIKMVLTTMVNSPEFWSKEALREKTKSPFELAISAVRTLDADITQPFQLYNWITKMGQKMYYYQAPTGFPDKGQYWINTGALLNRMNFGLALAAQKIPGVRINLAKLNNNHEPESPEAALTTYSKIIMPERDLSETIKRLTPMLSDPDLINKVDKAASNAVVPNASSTMMNADENRLMSDENMMVKPKDPKGKLAVNKAKQSSFGNNTMLAQVVGVIIGSPEFQRR